jgi:hypothetical protein
MLLRMTINTRPNSLAYYTDADIDHVVNLDTPKAYRVRVECIL